MDRDAPVQARIVSDLMSAALTGGIGAPLLNLSTNDFTSLCSGISLGLCEYYAHEQRVSTLFFVAWFRSYTSNSGANSLKFGTGGLFRFRNISELINR